MPVQFVTYFLSRGSRTADGRWMRPIMVAVPMVIIAATIKLWFFS
jgi:hypothetical protein